MNDFQGTGLIFVLFLKPAHFSQYLFILILVFFIIIFQYYFVFIIIIFAGTAFYYKIQYYVINTQNKPYPLFKNVLKYLLFNF